MKNLKQVLLTTVIATFAIGVTACTTTGNIERNAAAGAAAGAVAGAIIGNNTGDGDAKDGATAGAVLGGAAGAYKGYRDDQQYEGGTTQRQKAQGADLFYDQSANRYYYVDNSTGKTYWQNGELRSR